MSNNVWDETHTCTLVNMSALENAQAINNAKPPEDRVKMSEFGRGKYLVGNVGVEMNIDPYAISNAPESLCIVQGRHDTFAVSYLTREQSITKATQWAEVNAKQL